MRIFLFVILVSLFSLPAMAEEFIYSPEGCDFKMTFPDEPHAVKRCHEKLQDRCDLMTSYTQVFNLDATINFYVSCKETESDMRADFTPDLMRTSLLARPGISALEAYDISYNETEDARMAALIGGGPTPNKQDTMIYVTQIWAGAHSVMTVEAELIGQQQDIADKIFADILSSLSHKTEAQDGQQQIENSSETQEKAEATGE